MQSKSLVSRFFSRTIAGALFAVLVSLGVAPAVANAQVSFSVTKTGELLPDNRVRFTIVVTNTGEDLSQDFYHVYDPLPGVGTIYWLDTSVDFLTGCTVYDGGNSPVPGQQTLECDSNGMATGATRTYTVESLEPVDLTGCFTLRNTAYVYYSTETIDTAYDKLPPPIASGSGDITIGFCDGRMTGGGSIFFAPPEAKGNSKKSGTRVTHGFEIRCDASDHRQNLQVNWPNPNGNQNDFHLLEMTSAVCTDDPGIDQRPPKSAGFDTYIGEGNGRCNGKPASISFIFTDAGEPGTKDTAEYVITPDPVTGDPACALNTGPDPQNLIKGGNQQTHKN